MLDFSGQIVAITGATKGIGAQTARMFARQGASVHLLARDLDACESIREELSSGNNHHHTWQLDVRDVTAVRRVFREIRTTSGRLDVLVNNAGVAADGLAVRMEPEKWADVLATNLSGYFYCLQAALRLMLRRRYGRIVNVSSVVALGGNLGQANYSASKAGLLGLTKSVALEVASRGVTVNAVAPGPVQTSMLDRVSSEARQRILERIPVGRIADPAEIAAAVLFLASREAAFITGSTLVVDGGLCLG